MPGHSRSRPWVFVWFLFLASPAVGMGATTAYVEATRNLDLDRVALVVVSAPGVQRELYDRAAALFLQAGLPLAASRQSETATATLMLTLDPHRIGDACPGHILYTPSLALRESVTIPRNRAVIMDTTWLLGTDTYVSPEAPMSRLEADLDRFVTQFITDYRAANPRHGLETGLASPQEHHRDPSVIAPSRTQPMDHVGVMNLADSTLHLSVLAGRQTQSLRARAVRQLTEAGLRISQAGTGAVTIGIEFLQRSMGDQCPGQVLFERGLYVVEEVDITRNPSVRIWSDTWLRETVQVVAPVTAEQLEADLDALLRQLIQSSRTQ